MRLFVGIYTIVYNSRMTHTHHIFIYHIDNVTDKQRDAIVKDLMANHCIHTVYNGDEIEVKANHEMTDMLIDIGTRHDTDVTNWY